MLKEELRRYYLNLRRSLSSEDSERCSVSIANKVLSLPVWSYQYFHIFLPIPENNEVNTQHILSILSGRDKSIVVPKVVSGNHFMNCLLTDSTLLVPNKWGIPEPADGLEVPAEKIDVVFLPLLTFDMKGHRVGYGKGFYDSFLKNCRSDVIKVGLSFFEAVKEIEDIHSGDISMDYSVTPDRVYSF